MAELMSSLRSPWIVPAAVTAAVALTIFARPLASAGSSDLPERSAQDLVAAALEAEPVALTGTVVHTARLGLPELVAEAAGADPLALLGGSSTLRIWTDGEHRARVALLGTLSEYSAVVNGPEAWTYSSSEDEVVHYQLTAADRARFEALGDDAVGLTHQAQLPTPQEAAAQVLAHVEEFSTVVVDSQTTVAGRDAYQLIVTPASSGTLVDRVTLALDGETMTPLRVQTWSVTDTSAPAVEISFTDVDFEAPGDAALTFSAPAGASQREVLVPLPSEEDLATPRDPDHSTQRVTGTGWETVVELDGVDFAAMLAGNPAALTQLPTGSPEAQEQLLGEFIPDHAGALDQRALYEQLTTEVPEGRLFSSALVSALITNDGRILVGAVPAETLRSMA